MNSHRHPLPVPALALLAVVSLASPALADTSPPANDGKGFYLGGGGAWSTVSVEVGGYYSNDDYCGLWGCAYYKEGDGAYGFTAHAGYRFWPYLAAEVNYIDPGSIQWSQSNVLVEGYPGTFKAKATLDISAWEFSVLGILPFAKRWELYLRAGVGLWQGENDQLLVSNATGTQLRGRNDADGTDFAFGVGLGFAPIPSWLLRLEGQSLTIDGDLLYTKKDTGFDSVLFELQYRF